MSRPAVSAIFGDAKCIKGTDRCERVEIERGLPVNFVYGPGTRSSASPSSRSGTTTEPVASPPYLMRGLVCSSHGLAVPYVLWRSHTAPPKCFTK